MACILRHEGSILKHLSICLLCCKGH